MLLSRGSGLNDLERKIHITKRHKLTISCLTLRMLVVPYLQGNFHEVGYFE